MPTGTMKFWIEGKNFGFIIPDGPSGQPDVYIHASALQFAGIRN